MQAIWIVVLKAFARVFHTRRGGLLSETRKWFAAFGNEYCECSMDQDRVEGNWKQLKGAAKEQWGKLTNDDVTEINGLGRSARGQNPRALRTRKRPGPQGSGRLVQRTGLAA